MFGAQGSEFMVQDLGLRVPGSWFLVPGLGLALGLRVPGSWFLVPGLGLALGLRVPGSWFLVPGLGLAPCFKSGSPLKLRMENVTLCANTAHIMRLRARTAL